MISVTTEASAAINKTSRDFTARLLEGSTVLSGEIRRVTVHLGSCGGSAFMPGAVFSSYAEIIVAEPGLTFEGRTLKLQLGIKPVGYSYQYLTLGVFTAGRPSTSVYETTFLAYGSIATSFAGAFTPPSSQTVANVISALQTQTGVSIALSGLTASGTITKDMTGLTCRQALGVVAGVLGGYATEKNDGSVVIAKYTGTATATVDGSRMTALPSFGDSNSEISGVRVTIPGDDRTVYTSGTPNVERADAYMTQDLFSAYASNLIGLTYRSGTVKLALGDPRLEPWDVLGVTDPANNTYALPCMSIIHTFDGGLMTEVKAPGFAEATQILGETGRAVQEARDAAAAAAAAAAEALAQASEFIIGTQNAATGAWTGTCSALNELSDGTQITYWLPFAYAATGASSYTPTGGSASTGANLTLTLANGTVTDAIPCFYGGVTRLTNHYAAGNAIRLIYRENVTIGSATVEKGWWADANYDTNYYDRTRYNSNIKAAAAVTASHIIAGTSAGYKNLAASLAFDLSYPLLYAASAISSGSTGTNNYTAYPNIKFSTTGTIQSGTTAKAIYLKGTMSGTTFTIAASNWLTTVVPSTEDGFYYIPLGVMSSATNGSFVSSNQLWAYIEGAFQPVGVGAINAVAAEKTARENAISALSQALAAAGGLYETTETPSGGGTIYYLHDKPTKAASTVIIKLTSSALGISTDGGTTYSQGWDFATGTTITNILSTNGINADWINAGSILAEYLKLYGMMTVYTNSNLTSEGGKLGYTYGNNDFPVQVGMILASALLKGISIVSDSGAHLAYKGASDYLIQLDGGQIDISDMLYGRRVSLDDNGVLIQGGYQLPSDSLVYNIPQGNVRIVAAPNGNVYINGFLLSSRSNSGDSDLSQVDTRNWVYPSEMGALSDLTTTVKSSIVAAINELASGQSGSSSGAAAMATIFENSSPSTSQAAGTLTLAESIDDYNLFFVEVCWGTSYPTHRAGTWVYVPDGSTIVAHPSVDWYDGSYDAHVYRWVTINKSNNTISIGSGNKATGTNSGVTESGSYAVVTRILSARIFDSTSLSSWQGGSY